MTIDNPQPTTEELTWLACALDSEGSVGLMHRSDPNRKKFDCFFEICNTDAAYIVKCIEILDKLGCTYYIGQAWRPKATKYLFEIRIQALHTLAKVLHQLIPYLIVKKAKAQLVLKFVLLRLKKLEENGKAKYDESEDMLFDCFGRLNDCTQGTVEKLVMIQSELRGKLVELAEMTSRLQEKELEGH